MLRRPKKFKDYEIGFLYINEPEYRLTLEGVVNKADSIVGRGQ